MFLNSLPGNRQRRVLWLCASAAALIALAVAFHLSGRWWRIAAGPHLRVAPSDTVAESAVDLTERFSLVSPGGPDSLQRHGQITRQGESKDALVLVAPAAAGASLDGLAGRWILRFWAAPVFNTGDGLQMHVFIQRAGERMAVAGRYFDAGRNAEHRAWVPVAIQLEIHRGDQLVIEVSPGPQGESTSDWLAISVPRLTH